jgi:hypothetical protein
MLLIMWAIILSLTISSVIAIGWASGVGRMHEEYPDYDGDDFLNNDI